MSSNTPTILLVDDSRVNIDLLTKILTSYNLLTAYNGKDAIALAMASPKPDLILLDIIMPHTDGYEVCMTLKDEITTKDIPVIFITSQTNSDSIIKGFEVGAVDYITKPFKIFELLARVRTQLAIKMARDQNEELLKKIEDINKKLTDSIEYAQKIQNASLPKTDFLNNIIPDYFILLKPRDIVSGDFYWVQQTGTKLVVVAADCTGHGVPGAIMSMFGIAYLHQIVSVKGETSPAIILNQLRNVIIEALNQNEKSEVKDGMDMSVIAIDLSENTLEYAGAFNPIFIIRNNQMIIVPADNMPVSYGEIDRSFYNHVIPFLHGDCVYLFSDGFACQFGGNKNKKLKQGGFRQLLIDNHTLPMPQQKEVFNSFFEQWKGQNEQIDDVLLIGIQL